jgi:hypothetical protein
MKITEVSRCSYCAYYLSHAGTYEKMRKPLDLLSELRKRPSGGWTRVIADLRRVPRRRSRTALASRGHRWSPGHRGGLTRRSGGSDDGHFGLVWVCRRRGDLPWLRHCG